MTLYMHTLDREPAYYDGEQIVFAGREVRQLAASLDQIRRERAASRHWRISRGLTNEGWDYGYCRIKENLPSPRGRATTRRKRT